MLKVLFFVVSLCVFVPSSSGEISPQVGAKLKSHQWKERAEAYNLLAGQKTQSPEENAALVALLQLEDAPNSWPRRDPVDARRNDDDGDDGYNAYIDSLVGKVMKIADQEPQRPDAWAALFGGGYGAPSAVTSLFARHADKTAPYFLTAARGAFPGLPDSRRADALIVLAQIINFERDPATSHHLVSADLQLIEQTIRGMLTDRVVLVRMQALTAVGMIGTADDLAMLDQVAEADPYYDTEHKFYPYRVMAHAAAKDLRSRLAAPSKNAK
jgi:hypothetical protein